MGESAEDLLLADPMLSEVDRFGCSGVGLSRGELAEGAVGAPSWVTAPGVADTSADGVPVVCVWSIAATVK